MFSAKWMIPMAFIGTALAAQSASDLNGLVAAASHYVSSGMAGAHDPETLALSKITGGSGSPLPGILMTTATDVQQWTFLYRVGNGPFKPGADPDPDPNPNPEPQPHVAVLADCTQGVFGDFRYSSVAVTGLKSLEFTWVAVPLDTAILNLNANGYVRGFASVDLMRPDIPNFSDEFAYVFNCPWERREVAISCQTGALIWTYGY